MPNTVSIVLCFSCVAFHDCESAIFCICSHWNIHIVVCFHSQNIKKVLSVLSTLRVRHLWFVFILILVFVVSPWFQNDGVPPHPHPLEPLYILFLSALYFTRRSSCTFTEGQSRDKDSEDRLGKYTQHGAPLVRELMLSCWWLGWRVVTKRQRF